MRTRFRWILYCWLLIASAHAQEAPSAPTPCPEKCPFTLSGVALNAATNSPLPHVQVMLEGSVRAVTLTDGDGHFEFPQLPAGMVSLRVRKPGFMAANASLGMPGGATYVSRIDGNLSGLKLKLFPNAAITGRITDEHGLPAAGVGVHAFRRSNTGGGPHWEVAGNGSTDGRGQYRISPLSAGLYCLGTEPQPDRSDLRDDASATSGYSPTSYPCTTASPDESLALAAGQRLDANLQVRESQFYSINGSLGTSDTFSEGGLTLIPDSPFPTPTYVNVAKDGTFHSPPVPAGRYEVSGTVRSPSGALFAHASITIHGELSGIQLPLSPAVRIPISITSDTPDNSPEPATAYMDRHRHRMAWVQLIPTEVSDRVSAPESRSSDDAIDGVIPGSYHAFISAPGDKYVASATYGGINLLGPDPIQVAPGSSEPIKILLRSDGATISGSIKGQGQLAGWLLAVPDDPTGGVPRSIPLMPNGQFSITSVAPGSYTLGVSRDPEYLPRPSANLRNIELAHTRHITVQPNQQVAVELDLGEGE